MDHHVDLLERTVEEPVRLNQLETLVHQCGRINGDLGAHRPVRVSQRELWRDRVELLAIPAAQGPSRRGQDEPAYLARVGTVRVQTLPDGRVLTVDWTQLPRTGSRDRHDECAS